MNIPVQFDEEPKQEIYEFCDRQLDKFDDPIMRAAMAMFIVKHVVWACFGRVNNGHDLADHLEVMADCVREEMKSAKAGEEQPA